MQPGPGDWRGSVVPHTSHIVKTTLMQKIIFAAGMVRIGYTLFCCVYCNLYLLFVLITCTNSVMLKYLLVLCSIAIIIFSVQLYMLKLTIIL